jgi:hypothetical protein
MRKCFIVLPILGLAICLLVWFLIKEKPRVVPMSVKRPTLDSLINVHGSPEQGLRVHDRTFRRVRGAPPYYVAATNTPLLLFAYEPTKGSRVLVVFNTNDLSFREIPLGKAVFGDQIGYWTATKGQMGDIVESVSSNRLVLLSKGFRYVEKSVVDLSDETIRIVEAQSEFNQMGLSIWTNQQLPATNAKF